MEVRKFSCGPQESVTAANEIAHYRGAITASTAARRDIMQHALVVLHERVRGQLRGGRPVRWVVLEEKSQKVWAHLKEGKKNVRNARFGTRRYLRTEDTETVDTYRPATRAPPAAGSQRQW